VSFLLFIEVSLTKVHLESITEKERSMKRTHAHGDGNSKRIPTGMPALDHVLNGGLPPHRLYVVEGNPGAGKTTLALQFLLEGVRNGERVMYITLSETNDELNEVARSHGWSREGIELVELGDIAEQLHEQFDYTIYHPSDVELGETTKRVREAVEAFNPTRLALDSVSELKIMSQSGARYRREILGLKQFFSGRQCTVLILDDLTTREGEQQLQSIAHGVIRMERKNREYGTTRRQLHIVKMRGVSFRDGFHDFTITTGGIQIFPRLAAADHPRENARGTISSGVGGLDALLGEGLDRGSSTLVVGPAGCGKTTLCTQYLLAACKRNEAVACYLFEESTHTFLKRAQGLGMDLSSFVDRGLLKLHQLSAAELSPGEFAHSVRDAVEREGVRLVLIDSLNGYLNAMPSEVYLMIQMHELLTYLGHRGVLSLLVVSQHGMVGSGMKAPVDLSFLADTVILLRFFEAKGEVRQAISVLKKRLSTHERTIREMKLGPGGVSVGAPLRDFDGVLTGVPRYRGQSEPLLKASTDGR